MAEPMIYIKIHPSDNGSVIAMCDDSLMGAVLEEGDAFIDINTYSDFYKGRLVKKEDALKIITDVKDFYSANIVGKESVGIALEVGLIEKVNVKKVKKVPYAQSYRIIGSVV